MKQQIKTKQFALQYWVNELPEYCRAKSNFLCKTIQTQPVPSLSCHQKIGVELYLCKNANNYGMLGVEFLPFENNGNCKIEIACTNQKTLYQSSINRFDQPIFCGLIPEYAQDLQQTIEKVFAKQQLAFEGMIKVACAANSEIGSSKTMYRILFGLVLFLQKNCSEKNIVSQESLCSEVLRLYSYYTQKDKEF